MSTTITTVRFNIDANTSLWQQVLTSLINHDHIFKTQDIIDGFGEQASELLEDFLERYRPHTLSLDEHTLEGTMLSLSFEWPGMCLEPMADEFEAFLIACKATDIHFSFFSLNSD